MARSIMVLGTMSNVGKSLLAAGLCRIFRQDGYSVAPFKSQNMALNSYVTADGLEMGRAQVMQAEAAMVPPDVRMNPILLKPTNDTGSQVIVNGEVLGDMDAVSYFKYKRRLMGPVMEAYSYLDSVYDIIVLEGAGSAAEINLKEDDIVNIGMARQSRSPVLLAGDIDRGGVFAQLYGTVALLEEDERRYIKGLIINKFRGDKSILEPGLVMLEEKCSIPVLGVVPYTRLDVDDEDSLSERLGRRGSSREEALVDIAVVRLPHISNFTDINVLESIDRVCLRYVSRPDKLGNPDMVILPGTKNTMGDMKWMEESGMAGAVRDCHREGSLVFGICGGYQMLGEFLSDPDGVEEGGELKGVGLLPVSTVFTQEKRRAQVTGEILELKGPFSSLSGMELKGYEIHMGRTQALPDSSGLQEFIRVRDAAGTAGKSDMAESSGAAGSPGASDTAGDASHRDGFTTGDVFGTYMHGFFDAKGVARRVCSLLAARKGLTLSFPEGPEEDEWERKQQQYDILADVLRNSLDMDRIYRIMDEGV